MSDIAAVLVTAIICGTIVTITWMGTRAYRSSYEDDQDPE